MAKPKSLSDFLHAQKVRQCVVCLQVKPDLLKEIADAAEHRNTKVVDCLAWLKEEHGITITQAEWKAHTHRGHQLQHRTP